MYVLWCRLFQKVMKFFMDIVPFWRKPKMITGRDSLKKLPGMLRHKGIKNVMLVTDPGIAALGLHHQLLEWIREEGIECVVYDKTTANPTIANVEEALELYREHSCHALIAFGGGCRIYKGLRGICPCHCPQPWRGVRDSPRTGKRSDPALCVGGLRKFGTHVFGRAG